MDLKTQRNIAVSVAVILAALCLVLTIKAGVITFWYVASSSSDKYHKPSCEYVEQIYTGYLIRYGSAAAAEQDGREPCSLCLR